MISGSYDQPNPQVQVVVLPGRIEARAKAPLDASFADIRIIVDGKSPIPMDALKGEKVAAFEAGAATLIEQFIKGRALTLQLRFWPTWPQTGVKTIEFSLNGFTKAQREMSACG